MENKIKDMKVGLPTILGSTTINHSARVKLGLNASEYVMMDYIYRCVQKKREVDIMETYRQTGFDQTQQEVLLMHLVEKGFVVPKNVSPPEITDKWATAFTDIEREFNELFWRKDGKVFFTGSKKQSYTKYYALRKKYSREFMIKQRDEYARYLDLEHKRGFNRRVMMAERWLNPANEYYLVDWKEMADTIEEELKENQKKIDKSNQKAEKTETVTADQRKNKYEQDSNQ